MKSSSVSIRTVCFFTLVFILSTVQSADAQVNGLETERFGEEKNVAELSLPQRSSKESAPKPKTSDSISNFQTLPWKDIGIKLGIVVGIFVVVMMLFSNRKQSTVLPKEAIDVLGRVPLNAKQTLQLVKFGQKLVLMESSESGLKAISEITETDEVERLLDLIRGNAS